jgi:hypothetical protein
MSEQTNPSAGGHVPDSKAPREGETEERELTEYRQPPGERDQPGAREEERGGEAPEPR